ncbi:MAG: hypothetical protein LUO82_03800 [Methanomicrobiales archaeon]|nr:hypothetical protein [Methanomicrobiales archaeon]
MDIIKIIDEILGTSSYDRDYYFEDLLTQSQQRKINGIAVSGEKNQKLFIVFQDGEPEGVIVNDEKGTLFGDKAAFLLQGTENFELFIVNPEITKALASRCRVFDRSHVKKRMNESLPALGGKKHSIGVLCVTILKNGHPQKGVRVSIRRGRQELMNEMTTGDGKVCFRLMNGRYDCMVIDRENESYPFMVDFKDRHAETEIDIGGRGGE